MKSTRLIPINPLSLGIAYFVFSVLLLGLEHKTLASTVIGWVTFGVSVKPSVQKLPPILPTAKLTPDVSPILLLSTVSFSLK